MEESRFWSLIDQAREGTTHADAHAERLGRLLTELSDDEVVAFDRLFQTKVVEACRWDLWGAAYLLKGGASDDGFLYFRRWLVGRGKARYDAALADVESLADVAGGEEELEGELLGYAATEVIESRGLDPADAPRDPDEPAGERWEEEELTQRYPRLAKAVAGRAPTTEL